MKQKFTSLEIGETFHDEKIKERYPYKGKDGFRYIEYRKTSKSKALVVMQYGFGNQRQKGKEKAFHANTVVFKLS